MQPVNSVFRMLWLVHWSVNILDIHWLTIVTARATVFLMIWFFLKKARFSLIGYMLTLLFTSVSVKAQDIHLHFGE